MDLFEAIANRHSVRQYSTRPVEREVIEKIIAAGLLAPSACNIQPWDFVVVIDQAQRQRLAEVAEYGRFIATAPVFIAVFCKTGKWMIEDGAAATENILLAATALGLATCWIGGDNPRCQEGIAPILNVPSTHTLISIVALGHSDAAVTSPPRRPLSEALHWQTW
jgi:nitroreductase